MIIMEGEKKIFNPLRIIEIVCEITEISYDDLKSMSRKRALCEARQICFIMLKKYTSLSLNGIGRCFGTRKHDTVIPGIRTIQGVAEKDIRIQQLIERIDQNIQIRYF